MRDRVLRLFEQHHIPANILVSLPSLEGIKRAVGMQMGVALLPRRCAELEIARGELVALAMPEIRLRRQVRMVFRKGGERSHAATAFLAVIEDDTQRPTLAGPGPPKTAPTTVQPRTEAGSRWRARPRSGRAASRWCPTRQT
jgi:DNA-binding transcriptional LysR family regulator